ncbi:TetR/AcrR family transcriptional regulator [Pseudofrankia sp. BMG5.36]|uniref:TetR/AcrR family transcriptional regulator n=1 Tax=Pseudofrankia sp. BMG5.36 TaxID=1834512 RepID=UPI000B17C6BC|nr:TetR/AcrR family transcriptional regulator [Pseudofrankia sp. BMG5.36]
MRERSVRERSVRVESVPDHSTAAASTGSARPRAQRADARRNVEAILDAATQCLRRDADVSVADIATAAGVGRITLYGHFKTRAELVDAVLVRAIESAHATLDSVDLADDPAQALASLVTSSWRIVEQFRGVLHAAQRELPPERIRDVHDRVLDPVAALIEHGRQAGVFRDDLPTSWLVTVAMSLMHAAAEDVDNGRLEAADAASYLVTTLLAAFTAPAPRPGSPRPERSPRSSR